MNTATAKERILETASELFFNQGYSQTGINQIIEESKIAKGSLYYNFKSKTDVLTSYLKMSEETIFQYFEDGLSTEKDSKSKLLKLVDLRFDLLRKGRYKGCRFARIVSEISEEEEAVVLPVVRHFKNRFHSLIKGLTAQLKENETERAELADAIYLLMEGASTQASIFKDDAAFVQTRKIISSMI
ncbi:TetR/AcrR family transcriptional regulator [Chryseobacterium gossypii]|uniref:TetR/AcrR family transcriptional regulator n=1 Tax=Chryseobacterium gossypii TaxID=3231602 RepID=UPI003526457A